MWPAACRAIQPAREEIRRTASFPGYRAGQQYPDDVGIACEDAYRHRALILPQVDSAGAQPEKASAPAPTIPAAPTPAPTPAGANLGGGGDAAAMDEDEEDEELRLALQMSLAVRALLGCSTHAAHPSRSLCLWPTMHGSTFEIAHPLHPAWHVDSPTSVSAHCYHGSLQISPACQLDSRGSWVGQACVKIDKAESMPGLTRPAVHRRTLQTRRPRRAAPAAAQHSSSSRGAVWRMCWRIRST